MRVLTSMSDIRTKLLLGTTVGALAMIFVMAAGFNVLNTETGIAAQSGKLNGHVTLMAVNPDGSMSYAQGDNIIIDTGKTFASQQLFDVNQASVADVFECIVMGSGTEAADGADTIGVALVTTGQACVSTAAAGSSVLVVAPVNTDDPATTTITVVFPALVLTDLITIADTSVTITEVVLENAGGQDLSSIGLDADVVGVLGTVVTIEYEMTLT